MDARTVRGKITIDTSRQLKLNFKEARVKVVGWKKDYVKIRNLNTMHGCKASIIVGENEITLANFVQPTGLLYKLKDIKIVDEPNDYVPIDYEVHVPRNVPVAVTSAEFIRAIGCTVCVADSRHVLLKECEVTQNYVGNGEVIHLKRCTVHKKSTLNYDKVEMLGTTIKAGN